MYQVILTKLLTVFGNQNFIPLFKVIEVINGDIVNSFELLLAQVNGVQEMNVTTGGFFLGEEHQPINFFYYA